MESPEIIFKRSQVAEILNCTPLTIANREKAGIYPEPRRNPKNNYRYYTISDVFELQEISFNQIYFGPLLAVLWDMDYRDPVVCEKILTEAREEYDEKRRSTD